MTSNVIAPSWSRDYAALAEKLPADPHRTSAGSRLFDAAMRAISIRYKLIEGCENPLPMLVRYRFFDTPWGSLNVHRFLRSDEDRALHDHPFRFVSLVLAGGYIEHLPVPLDQKHGYQFTPSGTPITKPIVRRPGSLLSRPAHWIHRVELIDRRPAWTLIWISKKSREWGFYTARAWLPWFRYHETAGCAGEE